MDPDAELAGALDQPSKTGEDGRRVALVGGWLAGCKANLARRHGKAREGVEDQENIFALGRKGFGDRCRSEGSAQAQQRRLVGGGDDDHRTGAAFGAERVFEKLSHLAASFANQADHRNIGLGVAGHHADQSALAHPRSAKDADPLTASHGQHRVDRTNARAKSGANRRAIHRRAHQPVKGLRVGRAQGTTLVKRLAERVENAAHQGRTHLDLRTERPKQRRYRQIECLLSCRPAW